MEFDVDVTGCSGGKQFVTNCNGPITWNDNARELCVEIIRNGDSDGGRFFDVISRYDDVLAHVLHRESYHIGDTLRLILPFLKAFGATDTKVLRSSMDHLRILPGADKTMRFVHDLMPSFIVSASYEHHLMAVCDAIGFPFTDVYCTAVRIDVIEADEWEKELLRRIATEIASMEPMTMPPEAVSLDEFSDIDRANVERLDQLFWDELTDLETYDYIIEVDPVGGTEKTYSLMDIRRKTGIDMGDTMYIGDEITDVQAMQLVRESGGLAMSYNGDGYAIRDADVAIVSENTAVTSLLADVFYHGGRDAVLDLVDDWGLDTIRRSGMVDDYLVTEVTRVFGDRLPMVRRVDDDHMTEIVEASESFRRRWLG